MCGYYGGRGGAVVYVDILCMETEVLGVAGASVDISCVDTKVGRVLQVLVLIYCVWILKWVEWCRC